MTCGPKDKDGLTPCERRRKAAADAAKGGNIFEAVKQVAIGAAEMTGIKSNDSTVGREAPISGRDKSKGGSK